MDDRLMEIIRTGDRQALASMLRSGAMMSLDNQDRAALPRLIASTGNCEMLKLLASRSHAIAWEPDDEGCDVLHHAAMTGKADITRYAVEVLGFDPLRGNREGKTALDMAVGTEAGKWLESWCGFTSEEGYRNPVRRGFYPDPSIVRVGEDYYMVNSTFVQFPCLPVSHSRDLVHWETIGHAITRLDWSGIEGLPGGHGYWAPDISYHNGRFWVIATLRRNTEPFRLQMITSSANPEGPYDEPTFLDVDGIDPSLFTDVDGRRYMVINPGAQIVEISEKGEMLSEPEMIYYGSSRVKTEGPHLLYRDGWYYLFEAEGGTGPGHTETVARSRRLRGPYQPCPHNPILGSREGSAPIRRSGHGKPFSLPDGRWMMLYLCGRDVDGATMLGRETALDPLEWTADGWPVVNRGKGPSCLQKKPLPDAEHPMKEIGWFDFISPRTDPSSFASACGDGWRIRAGSVPSSLGEVSLLLRRQQERSYIQEVNVDGHSLKEGSMAGLCGYYDENSYYLFGLQREEEGFCLAVWEQIGLELKRRKVLKWHELSVRLQIRAEGFQRKLLYWQSGEWKQADELHAVYLSDEGLRMGKRFTGATLGMAAVGQGEMVDMHYSEEMITV